MKRAIFPILLCSAIAISGLYAQPKISVVGGTTLDFGDAYTGQKIDKVITIKNTGNDTLRISEVRAQCGCTATMMSDHDRNLAPEAVGKVSISFDTHNYGGSKVSKQVYVTSNDTASPKLTVTFTANVVNIMELDPKILSFDNMKLDSTYTRTVTITNPSPKNRVKILATDSKLENLKVSLMKNELMPGEKTQLQAVFHPIKTGTFQGAIELKTDFNASPILYITYYAWVNKK